MRPYKCRYHLGVKDHFRIASESRPLAAIQIPLEKEISLEWLERVDHLWPPYICRGLLGGKVQILMFCVSRPLAVHHVGTVKDFGPFNFNALFCFTRTTPDISTRGIFSSTGYRASSKSKFRKIWYNYPKNHNFFFKICCRGSNLDCPKPQNKELKHLHQFISKSSENAFKFLKKSILQNIVEYLMNYSSELM